VQARSASAADIAAASGAGCTACVAPSSAIAQLHYEPPALAGIEPFSEEFWQHCEADASSSDTKLHSTSSVLPRASLGDEIGLGAYGAVAAEQFERSRALKTAEARAWRRSDVALSLEMFEGDVQRVVSEYAAGHIAEDDFVEVRRSVMQGMPQVFEGETPGNCRAVMGVLLK
jgi:hypothetical protein